MTHRRILPEVWGPHAEGRTHCLRVFLANLRKKLEEDPARPVLLRTESGIGYRLCEPPEGGPESKGG